MAETLPIPPASVRALRDDESKRLDSLYPGLPKSLADCPTCSGMKEFLWYKDYPSDKSIVTYECPCADQIRLLKFFLNAGLGHSYQVLSWADVDDEVFRSNQEAIEAIQDYWQNSRAYVARGFGLLLYGSNGTGKTMLSSLLLKRLLTEGKGLDAYFSTFTSLLDNYAATWGYNKDQSEWFDRRVRFAEVLVIDDIGKEHANRVGMSSNALDNLFRTRVQHDLPTILTTNLSLGDFRATYSSSTWSLLAEKVFPYEIKGAYADKSIGFRDQQLARHKEELRNRLIRPIVWQ